MMKLWLERKGHNNNLTRTTLFIVLFVGLLIVLSLPFFLSPHGEYSIIRMLQFTYHLCKSTALHRLCRYEEAAFHYVQVLRQAPDMSLPYLKHLKNENEQKLRYQWFSMGHYEKVLTSLSAAHQLQSVDTLSDRGKMMDERILLVGLCYYFVGSREQCLTLVRQLEPLQCDNLKAALLIFRLKVKIGHTVGYGGLPACQSEALTHDIRVVLTIGDILWNNGYRKDARKCYDGAAATFPEYPAAIFRKAIARAVIDHDMQGAKALLEIVSNRDANYPGLSETLYRIGIQDTKRLNGYFSEQTDERIFASETPIDSAILLPTNRPFVFSKVEAKL